MDSHPGAGVRKSAGCGVSVIFHDEEHDPDEAAGEEQGAGDAEDIGAGAEPPGEKSGEVAADEEFKEFAGAAGAFGRDEG